MFFSRLPLDDIKSKLVGTVLWDTLYVLVHILFVFKFLNLYNYHYFVFINFFYNYNVITLIKYPKIKEVKNEWSNFTRAEIFQGT